MPGPDPNAPAVPPGSRAWVTLITRSSYLPGVILLVHSLIKHKTNHPIIVQYTSSLEEDCVQCLHDLLPIYKPLLHIQQVENVPLPDGHSSIAKRFDDTLTKLRIFATVDQQKHPAEPPLSETPQEACFLDADIVIFRNLDDIFDIPRPNADWISAHHTCVCNRDSDPWAPADYKPENCATSLFSHPEALNAPLTSSAKEGAIRTHTQLNSGVFVCTPSQDLWNRMEDFRLHDSRVKDFEFPDQNFLDVFFADHWVPIGWQYNAVKTHRYWHENAWRDEEVRALHYIVDKPWEARVKPDGTAGYKGRDGVTHAWWWREWEGWEREMEERQEKGVLDCVRRYVLVDTKLGETRFKS